MPKGIVQVTRLGKMGRFGNQIFQYLFARAYAEKYDAILEIPNWVGQKIFKNVEHPKPSVKLPTTKTDQVKWGMVNIDLGGYFQRKEFIDILSETKIRSWLQFQDRWEKRFPKEATFSVVAHLRRGDYISKFSNEYCEISKESYLRACDKFNIPKKNIRWVSEETQIKDPRLDDDLQFLPDFFLMVNADVLLRANSTFSFWAGFFNKNEVYSPVVRGKAGLNTVEFIEGNHASTVDTNVDFCFRV